MALLGSSTYTITRKSVATANVATGLLESTTTTFSIVATVRPAKGDDLQLLEDMYRSQDVRKIITEDTTNNLQLEDTITIDGNDYYIINIKDSTPHGFLQHWRAFAVKVKE